MSVVQRDVGTSTGKLAVHDHGGDGPEILFVHAPGFSGRCWTRVVQALNVEEPTARCMGLDLPGHGRSTASPVNADSVAGIIAEAITALGLTRPLLVAHDVSAAYALRIGVEHPDLICAIVTVNGTYPGNVDRYKGSYGITQTPQFADYLQNRYLIDRAFTADELDRALGQISEAINSDWVKTPDGMMPEDLRGQLFGTDDGRYMLRPSSNALTRLYKFDFTGPFAPGRGLYERLAVPVHAYCTRHSIISEALDYSGLLPAQFPLVTVHVEDGGHYPMYDGAQRLARVIALSMQQHAARPPARPMTTGA